jgi:hypothetical protein
MGLSSIDLKKVWVNLLLASVITFFSLRGWVFLAALVAFLAHNYIWIKAGERSWNFLLQSSQFWMPGVSWSVIVHLVVANNPGVPDTLGSFLVLSVLLGGWLIWLSHRSVGVKTALIVAGINQFLALQAIFLTAAFWDVPDIILLVMAWVSAYLVADRLLIEFQERSRAALATTWALVVAECTWIFAIWLVNYVVVWLEPAYLIIPQPAIVLTALGYCFGGIYVSHKEGKLSRGRLVEYLLIGLALLLIVITGTEWNKII